MTIPTFNKNQDFKSIHDEAKWLMTERLFKTEHFGENEDCERLYNIIEESERRLTELQKANVELRHERDELHQLVLELTGEAKDRKSMEEFLKFKFTSSK